jgi:hypothetical protein
MLREAGIQGKGYCYVLVGYKNDTQEKAEKRLFDTARAGFLPYAMVFINEDGFKPDGWGDFQRKWTLPRITRAILGANGINLRNEQRKVRPR